MNFNLSFWVIFLTSGTLFAMPLTPMSQYKKKFIIFTSIMVLGSLFYSPNLLSHPTREQFAQAVLKSIFDSYGAYMKNPSLKKLAPWNEELQRATKLLVVRGSQYRSISQSIVEGVKGNFDSPRKVLEFVLRPQSSYPKEWRGMIAYFMEREAEMLPLDNWRQARGLIEEGVSDPSLNYLKAYYLGRMEPKITDLLNTASAHHLPDSVRQPLSEIKTILQDKTFSSSYKIIRIEGVMNAIKRIEREEDPLFKKIRQILTNFQRLYEAEQRGFGIAGINRVGVAGIKDDFWRAQLRYGSMERKKLAIIILIEDDAIRRGLLEFDGLKIVLEWPDAEFRRYVADFIIRKERISDDIARVIETLCLQSTKYIPGEAKFNETISTMTLILLNPQMETFGAILGQSIRPKKSGETHFMVQKIAAIRALGMLETESALNILTRSSVSNPNFYNDLEAFPLLFRAYIDEIVSLSRTSHERLPQISQFLREMYSGLRDPKLRREIASGLGRIYKDSKNSESAAEMLFQMLNAEKEIIVKAELIFALSEFSFTNQILKQTVLKKVLSEMESSAELRLAGAIFRLRQDYQTGLAKEAILETFYSQNPRYPFSYLLRPESGSESSVTTLLLEFQRLSSRGEGGFVIAEIDSGLRNLLSQMKNEISADKITIEVVITYAHYGDWRPALGLFDGLSLENKRRIIEAAFSSENIDPKTFRIIVGKLFSLYDKDLKINLFQLLRDNGVAVNQKLEMLRGDPDTLRLLDSLYKDCQNPFMRKAIDELLFAIQQQ